MSLIYVFIGGGLGSVLRFLISKWTTNVGTFSFPISTLLSNLLACLLLAILVMNLQKHENTWVEPLMLVGFCGGFSTFSTFSNDNVELLQTGNYTIAIANILISLVLGIGLILWIRTR